MPSFAPQEKFENSRTAYNQYQFSSLFTEMSLTRRLPNAYADGVYQMAGADRPNPFDITWNTMRGLTGKASFLNRTAFMTFFGKFALLQGVVLILFTVLSNA